MTVGMHKTCSLGSAATRYIADNREPPASASDKNLQTSLLSTHNISQPLRPIADQPAPPKRVSLLKWFIQLFSGKRSTPAPHPPHTINFFGNAFSFHTDAIKRSLPGNETHTKTSAIITRLNKTILTIRRHYRSKSDASTEWNIIRDTRRTHCYLASIQSELEDLKVAFGDQRAYDTGLNLLIDDCNAFRQELDAMLSTHYDKQRSISTQNIKQINLDTLTIIEKVDKLFTKYNSKTTRKIELIDSQKKALTIENNIQRENLENTISVIKSNPLGYSSSELMETNNSLSCVKEALYKLNIDEHEKKLAAVFSSKIPRAKLKASHSPGLMQSDC